MTNEHVSRVGISVLWRRVRPSAQVDFRRMNRPGGIWRVLAFSTNGESRVAVSRVGIQSCDGAWDPAHKSTLGEMNGVTCDWSIGGGPAQPGPIKVSLLLSGGHSTIKTSDRQHVSLNFWKEGEEGEGGG